MIQKTGENELQVEVALSKSNALGVEANAVIFNAEGSVSSGVASTLRYDFDDLTEVDFSSLKALFAGRLDVVNQRLLTSNGKITLKTEMKNKGISLSGNFGIPILYFNGGSKGTYFSQGEMEDVEEDEVDHHHVYSAIKQKDHFSRGVLSKHMWRLESSIATILKDEHHPDESIMSVALNYSYSKDDLKSWNFKKLIKKASQFYHSQKLAQLSLSRNFLGYLKFEFSLTASASHILWMLHGDTLNKWLNEGMRLRSIEQRTFEFTRKHNDLLSLKTQIEKAHKLNDYKAMTTGLNAFLKILVSSERHMELFMQAQKRPEIILKIEGEKLKKD